MNATDYDGDIPWLQSNGCDCATCVDDVSFVERIQLVF
eukprot:gene3172-3076_t